VTVYRFRASHVAAVITLDFELPRWQTVGVKAIVLARIARIVRRERAQAGMTLRDVADKVGTTPSAICKLEAATTGSLGLVSSVLALFGFELVPRKKRI
jgi:ribosome-binding protein aMBF1 (putative translation factor)